MGIPVVIIHLYMDFPWNNHPASGIHHLWKSPYNPVCLGAFGCKLKLYPKCLTVPSSHCDCLCCQLCIFLWGGDGIVIQRTQWGVIIPTSCQICVHFPEELSMNFWITFLRVPSIHHSKGGVLFVFSFFTGIIVVYHCVRCLYPNQVGYIPVLSCLNSMCLS